MKCNKCGEDVLVQPGKSTNFCAGCGNKIEEEKTGGWQFFDNTKDLLAFIAAEYGIDALFGRKHFSDHSAPLMPQGQKNLVKQAFECGAVKVLRDNMNSDQARKETAVKQAAGKMVDAYASAKEAAERVVWEFTNAAGWGMPEPQVQSGPRVAPPPPPPGGNPPVAPGIGALITRAWQFAEDGDWKESADYFNKVLDSDPSYAPAYLGLLCVDLKVSNENKLANVADPGSIANHKYYKRAATDSNIKARLDGHIQTIKDRAEEAARKKRVLDAFDSACKIMGSAQSPGDYRKAITSFGNIDSSYQDINSQIKSKIAECERKTQQIAADLDKALAPLREKFSPKVKAEKQAKLREQRKADLERLNAENAKTKAEVEAKCVQIRQKFDGGHEAWQEEYNRLKAAYDAEYRKWEPGANAIKSQADSRKSQGLCPHCGGTLKGLFAKKCTECGKAPGEPVKTPSAPAQPNYPVEPRLPQMPAYTPKTLDESRYVLKEDSNSTTNQRINLAGIEWRILDAQSGKLLLISEKALENRPYNVKNETITWESCALRKYLNGDFYDKLGAAKSAVAETRNTNSSNPWCGTIGGNTTIDKVFLLSLDEVVKYFGDSGDLRNKIRKKSTGYTNPNGYYVHDQYNAARIAKDNSGKACWWWLRSPGSNSYRAAYVLDDGGVHVDGRNVFADSGGVRPAFWLNLES